MCIQDVSHAFDIVERYGTLGLLAVVVVGGGWILGTRLVNAQDRSTSAAQEVSKTLTILASELRDAINAMAARHRDYEDARDKAVQGLRDHVTEAKEEILRRIDDGRMRR